VRVVHGLERDTRVIAVEVAVLYEVLDGIDDLFIVRMAYARLCCANVPSSGRWPGLSVPQALQTISFAR
jgi:hypothetical protein